MKLTSLLESHKLIISVGSGGVGKTTTAAAIGLKAAKQGRKVLVLTIDPARRLANSLGLNQFGNQETQIQLAASIPGELWAMMLDTQSTFDGLIERVSPDQETKDKIFNNRVYRHISESFGGSQEYMATEQLYEVVCSNKYDLVVLDTPPVKNALDFLESPGRLVQFLDKRILTWFLAPQEEKRVFGRFFRGTSAVVFKLLGSIFGREFLDELSEFLFIFRDLYDGFRERHEAVIQLFEQPTTTFAVVCAPNEPSVAVAGYFLNELKARGMPCAGVLVNQMHPTLGESLDPASLLEEHARRLASDLDENTVNQFLARLGVNHRRLLGLSQSEQAMTGQLHPLLTSEQTMWQIPRLEGEVHDIEALGQIFDHVKEVHRE
jgi:anion-transporting  ArsA/GET3 family ATPase